MNYFVFIEKRREARRQRLRRDVQEQSEVLQRMNELSSLVQMQSDKIKKLTSLCEEYHKQWLCHDDHIKHLYEQPRVYYALRDKMNEAFGLINNGCQHIHRELQEQKVEAEGQMYSGFLIDNVKEEPV